MGTSWALDSWAFASWADGTWADLGSGGTGGYEDASNLMMMGIGQA